MKYFDASMPQRGSTAVVAMSGGVDSTLTASLLHEAGVKVIGATMRLSGGAMEAFSKPCSTGGACYADNHASDIQDCKNFCKELGLEHYIVDLGDEYKTAVVDYVTSSYLSGVTPNPCIICNEKIKFGAFITKLKEMGLSFDYFCTGHYARVATDAFGKYYVLRGADDTKDQTYFLSRLSSALLSKVRFPLGGFSKAEAYRMARERGLVAADKDESQDFATGDYFLKLFSKISKGPGAIIDESGKRIGQHDGLEHYTIGKRRGTRVALNYPVYVKSIDAKRNTLTVAPKERLFSNSIITGNFLWSGEKSAVTKSYEDLSLVTLPLKAKVKVRLASPTADCVVSKIEKDSEKMTDKIDKMGEVGEVGETDKVSEVGNASKTSEVCEVNKMGKANKTGTVGEVGKIGETGEVDKMGKIGEVGKVGKMDEVNISDNATFDCESLNSWHNGNLNDCDGGNSNNWDGRNLNDWDDNRFGAEASELYRIDFSTPQMAVAPGQSAVLYDEEGAIIGSGIILKAY